jgi:hypothetical protein
MVQSLWKRECGRENEDLTRGAKSAGSILIRILGLPGGWIWHDENSTSCLDKRLRSSLFVNVLELRKRARL